MKRILVSFLALMIPFMVFAGNRITQQQAMQIAGEFLNSSKVRMGTKSSSSSSRNMKLVEKAGEEEYFICSDATNRSFVIVSGDDALGPVLAYSTENAFVTENMPENVKFYLKMLEGEVKYYRTHPEAVPSNPNMDDDTEKVLETAKWNQSDPYYNFTPMQSGSHCVTGCVATAMAIVMRYHNWPDCGVGTIPEYTEKGITVPAIELGYAYDWGNMLMDYKPGRWSEAQGNAVARLMADCGAAVQMQYTASSSGAFSSDVAPALTKYFKYDKSIRYMYREGCTKAQWVKFIHDDIDNNRPLIFGAQSTQGSGGHEFVGAGYQGDDYVYINFGWGGSSNGFYYVTSMDEWGANVDAIFNIKPDEGGSPVEEARLGLASDLALTAPYVLGESFGVRAGWYNYGSASFTGKTGAGIRGVDNKLKNIVSKSHTDLAPNHGYSSSSYTFSTVKAVKAGEQVQLYYQPQGKTGWSKMNFYEDDVTGIVYPAGQKEDFIKYVKFSYDKSTKTMSFILPYNDVIDESTGATEFSWKLKDKSGNVVTSAVTYNDLVISIATGSLSAGKYTLELSYWDVTKSITLPIDNSVE
ncbi:MAG: C10 family peptidase [Bacteroidales bacterium]|nr:C10 family peptidase [Bacteroidales bacterium]